MTCAGRDDDLVRAIVLLATTACQPLSDVVRVFVREVLHAGARDGPASALAR